ncbi:MAG TPA: hypothetical protein VN641_07000 [Urbifossiella sp.]|nr:hypothetical protein [Urbifossiella sp.]
MAERVRGIHWHGSLRRIDMTGADYPSCRAASISDRKERSLADARGSVSTRLANDLHLF